MFTFEKNSNYVLLSKKNLIGSKCEEIFVTFGLLKFQQQNILLSIYLSKILSSLDCVISQIIWLEPISNLTPFK